MNITDNKTFWKIINPLLSDKVTSTQKITLIDKIAKNIDDTARVLNTFFSNNWHPLAENIQEAVLKAIVKYRNHLSILTIGEVCKKNPQISFRCVDKYEIFKEICQDLDIPSKIIKENADIFTNILHSNTSIYQSEFPSILKLVNITAVFETGDRNSKENYGPLCILSHIWKIFHRCMFLQISFLVDSHLSKQQCRFR